MVRVLDCPQTWAQLQLYFIFALNLALKWLKINSNWPVAPISYPKKKKRLLINWAGILVFFLPISKFLNSWRFCQHSMELLDKWFIKQKDFISRNWRDLSLKIRAIIEFSQDTQRIPLVKVIRKNVTRPELLSNGDGKWARLRLDWPQPRFFLFWKASPTVDRFGYKAQAFFGNIIAKFP